MRKLLMVLAVALLLGCGQKSKEEFFEQGSKLLSEGNPNGAVVLLKNALEQDQNYFEARHYLAKAYVSLGKYGKAENEILKAIRQMPNRDDLHLELARIYLSTDRPDEAIREAGLYLRAHPEDHLAYEIMGGGYAAKGMVKEAEELFLEALSRDPASDTAKVQLADLYVQGGRGEEARTILEAIIGNDPANTKAYHLLARLDLSSGDLDGAIRVYSRITEVDGSDAKALYLHGLLLLSKEDLSGAEDKARALLERFPKSADGRRINGMVQFYKGELDEAITEFQRSLKVESHLGSYYFLGLSYYGKGDLEQAMGQFNRALDISPSFVPARLLVSLILLRQGRMEDCIIEASRVLKQDATNAVAHNIMGSAYMAKAEYDKGIEELNRAIELNPDLVDAHVQKGMYKLGMGMIQEAETELRTAVEVAPEVLNSRILLASHYLNTGKFEEAIGTLKKGLSRQKKDAPLYNILAEVSLRQNKIENAIQYLKSAKEADPGYLSTYFNLASVYILAGKTDAGLGEFKSILQKSPENVRALLGIASMLKTSGDEKEAMRYYQRARSTGKTEAYVALVKHHLSRREPQRALEVLDEAIEKNPSEAYLYLLKGKVLVSMKKYPEALEAFEELALRQKELGISNIISLHILTKRPEKALARATKELDRYPESMELIAEASHLYMITGKKREALDKATQMITERPDSPAGYMFLAMIKRDEDDLSGAVETLKKALALDGSNVNLHMMLGNLYALQKDYPSALASLREADRKGPGSPSVMFQLGVVMQLIGDTQGAMAQYERVLSLSNNHVPALNNLAFLYAEGKGDLTRALQLATRAYLLSPDNGAVNDTIGYVMLKKGETEKALKALKRAEQLVPEDPHVHYHLALAYEEEGDTNRAVESLYQALRLGDFPEKGEARRLLERLQKG